MQLTQFSEAGGDEPKAEPGATYRGELWQWQFRLPLRLAGHNEACVLPCPPQNCTIVTLRVVLPGYSHIVLTL